MLVQRKNLYEQAQERVHKEGFAYKKGKSRCVYVLHSYPVCLCILVLHGSEKLVLISPLPPPLSVCVCFMCLSTMFTLELICCG